MDKLERYINYIVEDLVKDTKLIYEEEAIIYPFSSLPHSLFLLDIPLSVFSKYVKERYGVREKEIDLIKDLYKERIESIISNG